jgi:hypothetical protein
MLASVRNPRLAGLIPLLIVIGALLALALGVLSAFNTGSASPDGSMTCSVKTSCDASEVEVLRMSSPANAHAGTPSGSAYDYRVCCTEVSGLGTDCGTTPHAVVLRLSGTDNAHVASDIGYATEVCLSGGDDATVDCTYPVGGSCPTDYACLATISGSTNAHVADCDGVGDYATKVCCLVTADNCPDDPNPGQENFDDDQWGDVCDLDDDNDGYRDGEEQSKQSDDFNAAKTPEHCDAPLDNDGDTLVDEGFPDTNPGDPKDCLDASVDTDGDTDVNTIDLNDDSDPAVWNDGFSDAAERYMTTDELDACPDQPGSPGYYNPWGAPKDDAWPPDIDMNRVVDVTDAGLFLIAYPSAVGSKYYTRRLDMAAQNGLIDVTDAGVFLTYFPGNCPLP